MIRAILHGMFTLLVLILALGTAGLIGHALGPLLDRHTSRVIVLNALREVSELVLVERSFHQTIKRELDGYLGGQIVHVEAVGMQQLGLDLSRVRVVDIDPTRKHAVLKLPPVEVLHAGLDHEATSISAYETGLWPMSLAPSPAAGMIDDVLEEAAQQLHRNVTDPPLINVEARLTELLETVLNDPTWTVRVRSLDPD